MKNVNCKKYIVFGFCFSRIKCDISLNVTSGSSNKCGRKNYVGDSHYSFTT